MGDILKKNYPSAICLNCGKVTDIQMSDCYRKLMSAYNTLKEHNKFNELKISKIHRMKNSQILSMHKVIKMLLDLMTEEQRIKAKEISQFMRDELKRAEKEAFK